MDNSGKDNSKTPQQIVSLLEEHIVGHKQALATMANAIRYRWRRRMLVGAIRDEVTPKNILMIGGTGIGKTAMVRRLANLIDAPFLQVEATKFTEVGYVGRDVESMIKDLIDTAYMAEKEKSIAKLAPKVDKIVYARLADLYLQENHEEDKLNKMKKSEYNALQCSVIAKIKSGELAGESIDIDNGYGNGLEIITTNIGDDFDDGINSILENITSERKAKKSVTIADAFGIIRDDELHNSLNERELRTNAIAVAQNYGIIFIDEIDKLISKDGGGQSDVSRDGVQRDLLSIIEGTTISTKYGTIKTDHILFITAGAFIGVKPTDLMAELQGRLPVRVYLSELGIVDFENILTKPKFNLIRQYCELLACDNIKLSFSPSGVRAIAEYAFSLNKKTQDIGARRLNEILESLLAEIAFNAPPCDNKIKRICIDEGFVTNKLSCNTNIINLDECIL